MQKLERFVNYIKNKQPVIEDVNDKTGSSNYYLIIDNKRIKINDWAIVKMQLRFEWFL